MRPLSRSKERGLCSTDGKPIGDGVYSVRFAIYDAAAGGTALWTETQNVTQQGGVFDVYLGTITALPLDLFSDGDRWLGIKVGSDPEMAQRSRLAPSPWAIQAADSDKVDGFHASQTPTPNYILPLDNTGMLPASVIPPDDDWTISGNDIYRLTGHVGIGMAPGSFRLDVDGTARMGGFKMPTGASDGYVLTSDATGTGTWQAAAAGITGSGTANYIAKFTGASTIADSVIYQKADGNVGIGQTNPSQKLDVAGNLAVSGKAVIGPGHTSSGQYAFVSGRENTATGPYNTV
jgi:hypothetical protein